MKISEQIVIDDSNQNQEQEVLTTYSKSIHKAQISHKRKKTVKFGVKDRGSRLFKYLQEKQKAFLIYQPGKQFSFFSKEEDRILELLVRKLGKNFQRISKYFPAKTINMLKNRYYKHLRYNQTMVIDLEQELLQIDKKRIETNKILNIWPYKSNEIIESSPLFPEAKELLHQLFQHFEMIVEKSVDF